MSYHSVLLVEDNIIAQKAGRYCLERARCQVDLAPTAKEAIELALAYQYDLIIMDIALPDGDGREVTRTIRNTTRSRNHNTPIVSVTSHAKDHEEESCLAAGINEVYRKPLTAEKLDRILGAIF